MKRILSDTSQSKFSTCERGAIAVIFALSAVPLVAVSGAAVDYGRALSFKSQLQTAADATAIAAASADPDEAYSLAQNTLIGFGAPIDSVDIKIDEGRSLVVAQHNLPTVFMQVLGFETMPIEVVAAAELVTSSQKVCMLALNETEPHAISISGSAGFFGPECAVHSNSSDSEGMHIGNNATAVAAEFCSRGGYSAPADFDQRIRGNCWKINDPFAGKVGKPDTTGCTRTNFSVNPNQPTVVLGSGVYCGGLTIRGSVEFEPGARIVIKGGDFQINSQAKVRGNDVHFHLTGDNSGFTFNAGADINVSAPKNGDFGGILLSQDPTSSPGTENRLNGGANSVFNGAFYTPGHRLRLNGSSGFGQDSEYMPIIADMITVTGNTDMQLDLTGVNMVAPLPEVYRGVRLTQ